MPPPTDPPSARAVDVEALRRLVEGLQPGTSLWMTRADLLALLDQLAALRRRAGDDTPSEIE